MPEPKYKTEFEVTQAIALRLVPAWEGSYLYQKAREYQKWAALPNEASLQAQACCTRSYRDQLPSRLLYPTITGLVPGWD